jgi:hypothetical protein
MWSPAGPGHRLQVDIRRLVEPSDTAFRSCDALASDQIGHAEAFGRFRSRPGAAGLRGIRADDRQHVTRRGGPYRLMASIEFNIPW